VARTGVGVPVPLVAGQSDRLLWCLRITDTLPTAVNIHRGRSHRTATAAGWTGWTHGRPSACPARSILSRIATALWTTQRSIWVGTQNIAPVVEM